MTRNLLLIGTGLIGGSIGLGLRATGSWHVRGYDRAPEHAQLALQTGAIDEVADDLHTAGEADVIVVATPIGQILPTIGALAPEIRSGTVVTDVGSTKAPIAVEAQRLLGADRRFVGGHPMAGTEREGVLAARADLFEGTLWLLTPTRDTDPEAYRTVHGLVATLGARSLALEPAEHDRLVALISHLPYAVATVLMELAGTEGDERVFRAAAGSFRDLTRTAGSNPSIWRDILLTNRAALLDEIDAFMAALRVFRDALADEDWERVNTAIHNARAARARFPLKGERTPAEAVDLEVPVPDRAGVLAHIATALGESGINIEDLWMEHTAHGGVVRLVIDGRSVAARATERLTMEGFRPMVLGER